MTNRQVAETMLAQIGNGNLMACGARDYVFGENYIHFNVGRGRSQKITITLDPSDTYTVKLVKIFLRGRRLGESETIEESSFVYCDNLGAVVYGFCNK